MRFALAVILFIVAACSRPMPVALAAPAVVHSTQCSNFGAVAASFVCTLSATPAAGNVLLITVFADTNPGPCPTSHVVSGGTGTTTIDSGCNTAPGASNGSDLTAYLVVPVSPPTTLTWTLTTGAAAWGGVVLELSGVSVFAIPDKHGRALSGLSTTCSVPVVTPSQANDFAFLYSSDDPGDDQPIASLNSSSPSLTWTNYFTGGQLVAASAVDSGTGSITSTAVWSDSNDSKACGIVLLSPTHLIQAGGMVGDILFEQLVKML